MNPQEFDRIMDERITQCVATLSTKEGEYSQGGDRFHNFKRAAEIVGSTPERALIGMANKHLVSVLDIIDNLDRGYLAEKALWNEKIGDLLNYLLLLDGMLQERYGRGYSATDNNMG